MDDKSSLKLTNRSIRYVSFTEKISYGIQEDKSEKKSINALFPKAVVQVNLYDKNKLTINIDKLRSFESNAFQKLAKLNSLDIFMGFKKILEDNIFKELTQLKALRIYFHNHSTCIKSKAFDGLGKLEELSIVGLHKTMSPDMLKGLVNLKKLIIEHCSGHDFNMLRNNSLVHLQSSLREIDLSHVTIKVIDIRFSREIEQLEKITLSYNELKIIHVTALTEMSELESISILHNQVCTINLQVFSNLPRLKRITLCHNQIEEVKNKRTGGESLCDFENVEFLDLNSNQIAQLDCTLFENMLQLKELDISQNIICSVEANSFAPLVNLIHLNLSENNLTEINAKTFNGLIHLQTLDVSHNKVSLIQPKSFDELFKLERLNLSHNKLTQLDASLICKLNELDEVNLDGNTSDLSELLESNKRRRIE